MTVGPSEPAYRCGLQTNLYGHVQKTGLGATREKALTKVSGVFQGDECK